MRPVKSPGHQVITSSALLGPGAMLLSALLFAGMGALVKMAGRGGVPAAETTFVRFAVGLITCLLLARAGVIRLQFRRRRLHVVRGLFGSASALLFFVSITLTDLARATLLCQTYVVFSALFAAAALRERLGSGAVAALAVSLTGVALVTGARLSGVGPGEAAGLLAGLLGGVAVTSIRELRKTESAYAIFAAFCVFGVVVCLAAKGEPWPVPSGLTLLALLGAAVLATVAQLLMTVAYRYCTTATGGLLSLVTVVVAALIGFLCFGERLSRETLAGAALILGAAAYLTLAEANGRPPVAARAVDARVGAEPAALVDQEVGAAGLPPA